MLFWALVQHCDFLDLNTMLVWTIWYRQNQIRNKHVEFPASQVLSQVFQMLHEFYRVQLALPSRPLSQTQTQVHWQPPPNSILKGNFDGATFKDVNMVGLGVVVHDSQGQVLASLSENIRLHPSTDDVEALVVAKAILFVYDCGFSSIILKGDSEVVIKALQSNEDSFASFGHLLSSLKNTIDAFDFISLSHTHRAGNSIVRYLTKHARHVSSISTWMEGVPPHLFNVFLANYG